MGYAGRTGVGDRLWWYKKVAMGRVRSMAQARQSANTGTIAYVFDKDGYILWVEPIRFFNLQRNLGNWADVFPETTTFGNDGDKDRRPGVSWGNVREGTSSQSLPVLAPASTIRDSVLDNVGMTFGESVMGESTTMFIAARSVNNVFFDLENLDGTSSFSKAITPAMSKLRNG